MPGPIIALWIILAGAGSALLGPPAIWKGTDPTVRRGGYPAEPISYRTWTGGPDIGADGTCRFTVFVMVSRGELRRLRINGVEQLVDWSWSWPVTVPAGMVGGGLVVEIIHPETGERVVREITAVCPHRQAHDGKQRLP